MLSDGEVEQRREGELERGRCGRIKCVGRESGE